MKNLEEFLTEGLFGGSDHKAPASNEMDIIRDEIDDKIKGLKWGSSPQKGDMQITNVKGLKYVNFYKDFRGVYVMRTYKPGASSTRKAIELADRDEFIEKAIKFINKYGVE